VSLVSDGDAVLKRVLPKNAASPLARLAALAHLACHTATTGVRMCTFDALRTMLELGVRASPQFLSDGLCTTCARTHVASDGAAVVVGRPCSKTCRTRQLLYRLSIQMAMPLLEKRFVGDSDGDGMCATTGLFTTVIAKLIAEYAS
jgi:hypothetical protein